VPRTYELLNPALITITTTITIATTTTIIITSMIIIITFTASSKAVPWLKRLVAGLSPRRPGFAPGSIHVGFMVDSVALGQVFLRVLRFSPVNIIPPLLHIHLSPPHEVCDCSDQAAHYHHLGPKLGASLLTRHIGWKQNKKVNYVISTGTSVVAIEVIAERTALL
jgi:hypothetical protein